MPLRTLLALMAVAMLATSARAQEPKPDAEKKDAPAAAPAEGEKKDAPAAPAEEKKADADAKKDAPAEAKKDAPAEAKKDAPAEAKKDDQPMSPAEQKMMARYMAAGKPGPEHERLAKMVGKWNLETTSWPSPGAKPRKSGGTAEFKSLLGGRFVEQHVKGDMGGGYSFEGIGLDGYDNVSKEWFSTWIDSMSTGPMIAYGKCKVGAKKCTMKAKASDALAGKKVNMTMTLTHVDDNKMIFEMTGPSPKGKVFKMMEIVYTRAQ